LTFKNTEDEQQFCPDGGQAMTKQTYKLNW